MKETLTAPLSAVLSEFANRVSHMRNLLRFGYKNNLERQAENAGLLISLIKKEYHLE
jgi:hypothetical protein